MLGGNGINANDVDYAKVGGATAMVRVCMAGTAVKIENQETVFKSDSNKFVRIIEILKRVEFFSNLKYTTY